MHTEGLLGMCTHMHVICMHDDKLWAEAQGAAHNGSPGMWDQRKERLPHGEIVILSTNRSRWAGATVSLRPQSMLAQSYPPALAGPRAT